MGRARRMLCAVLWCSAGCAQIAGIDETSGPGNLGETATLTLDRSSIGTSVITAPLDLAGLSATFVVLDEDEPDGLLRIAAENAEPGVWTGRYQSATPPWVLFTLPDEPEPFYRMWQTGSAASRGVMAVLEHPAPVAPMATDMLTVSATLPTPYAATESLQLYNVGPWGARGIPEVPAVGDPVLPTLAIPYAQVGLGGRPPRSRISTSDAVMVLRYDARRLTGVLEAAPFEQTGNDAIGGVMTAIPATETLTVTLNNATVGARFAPVRPGMPAPGMSWELNAAPGADLVSNAGPQLNASGVTADPLESMVSAPYSNPFTPKSWKTLLTWRASSSRSFVPTGAVGPVALQASLLQVLEPAAGAVLDHPAGMPELITIGDQPLSTDGVVFPKPARAVTASFVVPPSPVNDLYALILYELVPNGTNDGLTLEPVLAMTSTEPEFVIPPEFFTEGRHYTLRAEAYAGSFPGRATGDIGTRSLPFAMGSMDSGVFTVGAAQ